MAQLDWPFQMDAVWKGDVTLVYGWEEDMDEEWSFLLEGPITRETAQDERAIPDVLALGDRTYAYKACVWRPDVSHAYLEGIAALHRMSLLRLLDWIETPEAELRYPIDVAFEPDEFFWRCAERVTGKKFDDQYRSRKRHHLYTCAC